MMSKLKCDEAVKWPVVCAPLAVFVFVMGIAFWSMTIIPRQKVLHLSESSGAILMNTAEDAQPDCDVCVEVHMGDDGTNPPSEKILPFPLLLKLFEMVRKIKKPAQRENIVCVGVDHPAIVCRMVRDALGRDANCWQFQDIPLRETGVVCNHMVVGRTSQYLPQFDNQTSGRFVARQMHIVDFDATVDAQNPNLAMTDVRPTIVTGFSANHLSVGLLLLRYIAKAAFTANFTISVIVWTMEDFRGKDRDDLQCVMKEIQESSRLIDVEVRRFKFWQFPEWMRIQQAHDGFNEFGTGEYAWKVVMIHTVLVERGLVLWTDAGDRFKTTNSLTETLTYIAQNGFASRTSSGSVDQWTHRGTILYLRAGMKLDMLGRNCDGSAVGFTMRKYWELVRPWYECAMTRQCIAPEGSNRSNHRQDQAALTVLARLSGSECCGVEGDVGRHMDYKLGDVAGAAPSSCYEDPRRS